MRLEDCVLDVDVAVTAPLQWREPEDDWVQALNSQAIPREVFNLYSRAGYLSFGAAPPFLSDKENILEGVPGIVEG
jgi:hypothetical protein